MLHRTASAVLVLALGLAVGPAMGRAAEPSRAEAPALVPLLGRVADHAARLEQMEKRGSFLLRGRMEELDGSGQVGGTKELVVRVTAKPSERVTEIIEYLEDGADKTAEAREKQARESKREQDPKKKFVLPFARSAQARYTFAIAERDTKSASRVRITFQPLERAENAYVGSAWVDEASGEILTMGFSPSKNPLFVDHVDVRVRFENPTELGRAPSEISFEARGSLLLFKKHYRGSATLTEAKIAF